MLAKVRDKMSVTFGKLRSMSSGRVRVSLAITAIVVMIVGALAVARFARAASYCSVTYTVTNQWPGGFGVQTIGITNTSGSAWTSWTLTWTFPAAGQAIQAGNGWNGNFSQSGQNVTVTNMSYNGSVANNASVNPPPGFNGTWTTSNPVPTNFAVNGNSCGGSGGNPTATPTQSGGNTPTATPTRASTPTVTPTPPPNGVSVNASSSLGQISSTAFGINNAVWDGSLLDSNLPGLLSADGVNIMRYPGGSTSDVYHWQSHSAINGNYVTPGDNFDAFMGQVQKVGAQAMITVNYGSGTAQEAAGWVQYANKGGSGYSGPVPTYSGGSSTGHTYGIKYWEIGNEQYGDGTYGSSWEQNNNTHGPTAYANNAVAFSKAMKAVDSSIKIGLVVTTPNNWPDGVTNSSSPQAWNDTVLPIACNNIDFVIMHWYPQGPGSESDATLLSAKSQIASMVSTMRSKINQYCGSHASAVQIMVTETNSVSYNPGKQTVSLVNGLYLADEYMTWLENGVTNVDWWDTHNGFTGGNNNSSSLYGNTDYGDYGLLSTGGCATGSTTDCEPPNETPFPPYYGYQMLTHLGKPGDTMLSASSGINLVSVHAVKQANGKIAVLLINTDPNNSYNVPVSLSGATSSGTATVYTYGKNSTSISSSSLSVSGSSFTVSVAPYSLTTVDLP